MRSSIPAQSSASVPPAPELISMIAPIRSSSRRSMLRSSSSSMRCIARAYCSSSSCSVTTPSLTNSGINRRSSTSLTTASYSSTHALIPATRRNCSRALSGLSQKPGTCVFSSSFWSSILRWSMSKTPPQRILTSYSLFNLFCKYHIFRLIITGRNRAGSSARITVPPVFSNKCK